MRTSIARGAVTAAGLALLAFCLAAPAAAGRLELPAEVHVFHPPFGVAASTVSASQSERINRQIPPNAEPAITDASLKKSAVGPGYTVLALPAFVYSRNEGAWVGGLAPIFRANDKGQVEDIIAPLYLHNGLIGDTFTLNYFGYRNATREYHAILSHATKIERAADVAYKDTGVDEGRYIVSLAANSGKSAFNRFFGFGNEASSRQESNYAMGDANVIVGGGVNLGHSVSLLAAERWRAVSIENGAVSSLPQTLQAFPNAPGTGGADIWSQGLTLAYDTRDNQLTPLKGADAALTVQSERNEKPGSRDQWWRLTAEAKNYFPHADDRAVFVSRVMFDDLPDDDSGMVRQGIPFYDRPTLGGQSTLRGFGEGRFVGSYAMLVDLEERVALVQRSVWGNLIELEAAPFLDFGRVGPRVAYAGFFHDLQFNPGLGLRVLARPNIASRVDVAYGRDGFNVFVGLDYPF
jgi:hypothetical protein